MLEYMRWKKNEKEIIIYLNRDLRDIEPPARSIMGLLVTIGIVTTKRPNKYIIDLFCYFTVKKNKK